MFFVGEVIFGPCIVKQYPVSFFLLCDHFTTMGWYA